MKNRKNNKGFSLVELIVVVAIMAVLVGVLAPAYLKYVENSRIQKDVSAIGEVVNAIEIAMADEDVNKDTTTKEFTITGTLTFTASAAAGDKLQNELSSTIGTVTLTSNGLKAAPIKITVANTTGVPTITVTPTGTGNTAPSAAALTALQKLAEYKAQ